jgi:uncharacterized membrane protein
MEKSFWKLMYRVGKSELLAGITSVVAAICVLITSISSMFFTEKNLSESIDSQYFILTISIILPLVLIFLVTVIIYQINKKRKNNKITIYKQIKDVEKKLFTNINECLEKYLSSGVQNG